MIHGLSKKLQIKFFLFKYGFYALIFILIFGFAFILDKHIEAFFLFFTYVLLRYKFPTTFHHPNFYWCLFWSVASFWICIVFVLPLHISILSTVVIGTLLCFILYKIQEHVDMRAELEKQANHIETREEFIDRCKRAKLSNESTEIAVAYLFDKSITIQEIADKYGIEYDSARIRLKRIRKKLNSL